VISRLIDSQEPPRAFGNARNFRLVRSSPKLPRELLKKMETEFNQHVQYFRDLGRKYTEAQQLIAKLQKERDAFGGSIICD
jgi:hypothetical protein